MQDDRCWQCGHDDVEQELVADESEVGHEFTFLRKTCKKCGRWLSDQLT